MNLPILYLQLSFALRTGVRFKIGITRRGMMRRSRNIWKSTPGVQFPVFFCVVPFVGAVEKWMHGQFAYCHAPQRRGSGRTEWFRAGFLGLNLWVALAYYLAVWVVEGLGAWWAWNKIIPFLLA
jgi:hypothetical protein